MGEGTFGFDLTAVPLVGGASVLDLSAFDPSARRTAVNCSLGDADIANTIRFGGLPGLYNYAAVLQRYGGLTNTCGTIDKLKAAIGAMGGDVSFIDSLVNGIGAIGTTIGNVFTGIVEAAPSIATGVQVINNAINSIQGDPVMSMTINPNTGTPMTGAAAAQMAFTQACNADPTGQCQAAIRAALSGMAANPVTGAPMMPGIAMAGVGTALNNFTTRALMDPRLRALAGALGLGAAVAGGEAAVGALLGPTGATGANQGPLLIPWPAGTPYPRGIVLRAEDKPEKRYRSEGAALLRSGDVAAVRRVAKAASRARRGRGRRSGSRPSIMMIPSGTANVCGSCLTAPCGCK